jgi:hypothetical protein
LRRADNRVVEGDARVGLRRLRFCKSTFLLSSLKLSFDGLPQRIVVAASLVEVCGALYRVGFLQGGAEDGLFAHGGVDLSEDLDSVSHWHADYWTPAH